MQDRALCGAYQFTTDTWVEKHCYAKGIVVWYRNEGVRDNNTYFHPGQGEILPVDSHPDRMLAPDGKKVWSGRWQAWDAPFSLDRQNITLVQAGVGSKTYTAEPVTTFWDSSPTAYYRAEPAVQLRQDGGLGRAPAGARRQPGPLRSLHGAGRTRSSATGSPRGSALAGPRRCRPVDR